MTLFSDSWIEEKLAKFDDDAHSVLTESWSKKWTHLGPENKEQFIWLSRVCYFAIFCTGMINVICVWGMDAPASSGHSGNIRKFAGQVLGPEWYKAYQIIFCPMCFTFGVIVSGIWTNQKESRTLETAAKCMMLAGATMMFVAALVSQGEWPHQREVMYGACWASGLQGGMLKATTGYADTTGVSGTLTDIGLMVGQAFHPSNRSKQTASKFLTLVSLVFCFIFGAFSGSLLLIALDWDHPKEKAAGDVVVAIALVCPAALLLILGIASYAIARRLIRVSDGDEWEQQVVKEKSHREIPNRKESAEIGRVNPLQISKLVDEQKDAIVRTALLSAFLTGATNYVATDILSKQLNKRRDSVSHISGPVYRLGIGVADVVTSQNKIELHGLQASAFVLPGLETIGFWLLGAVTSGIITREKASKNYRTGAAVMVITGFSLIILGTLLALGITKNILPGFCFSFGLLNGTMSAITGFARTGHFTGVLMNVGLLYGQLTNPENAKPEVMWKLRQSCNLVLSWAAGTALQGLTCRIVAKILYAIHGTNEKEAMLEASCACVVFCGIGFIFLGWVRLKLRALRIKRMVAQARQGGSDSAIDTIKMLDKMVHGELQDLGAAGGFTLDLSLYPVAPGKPIARASTSSLELQTFSHASTIQ